MTTVNAAPFFLSCLLIVAPLAGCLFEEEEKPQGSGFEWTDRSQPECEPLQVDVACREYLTGFTTPVNSLQHPLVDELWIADLDGRILAYDGNALRQVANLSNLISNCHTEAGLLGFTFTSHFETNPQILFTYIGDAVCETKEVTNLFLAVADVTDGQVNHESVTVLREIEQPYRNHNGGHLLGLENNTYLWGVGDGGGSNDPLDHGQNNTSMLGTIQHFWYHNQTITPLHNASNSEQDYVLHKGLRNPWKFDVDPMGRLWIADVGQNCFEEVNAVNVFEPSNFGWSEREANRVFDDPHDCTTPPSEPPVGMTDTVVVYQHENGRCSITGGYWLDWGPSMWQNGYLFADFCSGEIWLAQQSNEGNWDERVLVNTGNLIVGFGKGLDDELLLFTWGGSIYHLDPHEATNEPV